MKLLNSLVKGTGIALTLVLGSVGLALTSLAFSSALCFILLILLDLQEVITRGFLIKMWLISAMPFYVAMEISVLLRTNKILSDRKR